MAGNLTNDSYSFLRSLLGNTATGTTSGPSSVSAEAPFVRYGVMPPEAPSLGKLEPYFPGGATPSQPENLLSPGMTKGLNSITPILLAAGLLPLTQRGTGASPQVVPGRLNAASPFLLPSEVLARLLAAQRRG